MNRRKALKNTGLIAGATVLLPSFLTLLQSCKSEPRLNWQPLFLTQDEAIFISSLVDTILPKTDTPGALEVKADIFLDKVFALTYNEEAQKKIRADIAQFNANCQQKNGASFSDLNTAGKAKALKEAEANSGKFNPGVWGTAVGKQEPVGFYRSIKSMAIWAYLSSEEIGKNVLNYDPIPMVYEGCIPLRKWETNGLFKMELFVY
mgnify:CR=1 FL=1